MMLVNNLRISIRRLGKDKFFSAVNVLSLSLGLAAVWVIVTYLNHELGYEDFHEKRNTIFRVTEAYNDDARFVHSAMSHGPMKHVLEHRLPGLRKVTRILPYEAYLQAPPSEKRRDSDLIFADSSFFSTFSFPVLEGSTQVFQSPFSIVLTESAALTYFGSLDVVGKPIVFEDARTTQTYYVTALLKDVPQNSHFRFSAVLNMASLEEIMPWYDNWHHPPHYLYMEMDRTVDAVTLSAHVQRLADLHQPEQVRAEHRQYTVQPITSIHLHSSLYDEWEANSQISHVRLFAGVCFFLMLVACINFINLSMAQAARRAREIGVRKVLGAFRRQLTVQLLAETFVLTTVSLLIALGIAELLLMTAFAKVFDIRLSLTFLFEGWNIVGLVLLLLLITFTAGAYPAFFLSRFKTTLTLKGKVGEPGSLLGFRRGLVLFQFLVTGFLIMGTLVVVRQSGLLRNKHLGFEKEALVAVKMVDQYANENYLALKQELMQDSRIKVAAISSEIPGGNGFHGFELIPEGYENEITMKTLGMDEDFIDTYGISVVSGRTFSKDILADEEEALILNETAVKQFSWTPEEALGKTCDLIFYTDKKVVRKCKVIGVVRDFHFESLYHPIQPLILYQNKHPYYSDFLTVKVSQDDLSGSLNVIEEKWSKFRPEKPLEFVFIDDRLDRLYSEETKISSILGGFSSLSIVISALGLFGLAAHTAQRRTKEISIRKVLGASASQLLALLGREYMYLVLAANVLAWPLVLAVCNGWLETFPYRISIGMDVLFVTVLFTLFVALLTTAVQCLKVAMANPAEALKSE